MQNRQTRIMTLLPTVLLMMVVVSVDGIFHFGRRPHPFQQLQIQQPSRNHNNNHHHHHQFNLVTCLSNGCGLKLKLCVHNEATNNNVQEMILCFQANHVCRQQCILRMEKRELKRQMAISRHRLIAKQQKRDNGKKRVVIGWNHISKRKRAAITTVESTFQSSWQVYTCSNLRKTTAHPEKQRRRDDKRNESFGWDYVPNRSAAKVKANTSQKTMAHLTKQWKTRKKKISGWTSSLYLHKQVSLFGNFTMVIDKINFSGYW